MKMFRKGLYKAVLSGAERKKKTKGLNLRLNYVLAHMCTFIIKINVIIEMRQMYKYT